MLQTTLPLATTTTVNGTKMLMPLNLDQEQMLMFLALLASSLPQMMKAGGESVDLSRSTLFYV
jgi:hypothetical protein